MTTGAASSPSTRMLRSRALPGVVAALMISTCAGQPAERRTAGGDQLHATLDAMFDEARERYHLPGLALGVVRDGKIIYARAAGETTAGSGEALTPGTLFKIASNSKAMTTGVLARLVDAGRLRWDDPVIRHLPQFRMHDPWVTRELQVRDLLIHNSGLRAGAGDLMLWPEPNSFTRTDIIAGLAHLKPLHSFRSRYDYDNLLYVVAGEVAAAAAGVSYEDVLRRELFAPLGMSRCRVGVWRRDEVGNVAQPHMHEGGRNVVIRGDEAVIPLSTSAAAGGIRCSLSDMLKWVRMWLDPDLRAAPGGEPWLSPAQRAALWSAHMPMPISERQRRSDGSRFNAYGYGWRVSDVEGVLRIAHTGTLAGMYSAVTLLPEKNTGFVFMINGQGSDARAVLNAALGGLFATPSRSQPLAYYADELEREGREQVSSPPAEPPARAPPDPASLKRWLGTYRDPWFGEITVCERERLIEFSSLRSPRLKGAVMQAGERLLIDWHEASIDAEAWLDFAAPGGGPPTLALAKVDPRADFSYDYEDLSFTRVGDCPDGPRASGGDDALKSRIDALMREYRGAVPGAAVLVVSRGVPIVRTAYGMADLEAGIAARPATNFRLASISKQFTAAAILLLARGGRLGLDDPASKWLPSLPPAAKAVTIRQLLTHTSGLIDYEDVMPPESTAQLRDADVLSLLEAQDRTYFPPSTAYRYSNGAYALLALIVGRVSGRDFATFLRERIFEPLGMGATVAFEDGRSSVPERAFGYTLIDGAWARTDQSPTSAVLGDGGIYSSIDDLARWDAALSEGSLLPPELLAAAFAPATATDDPDVRYGFGWRITGDTVWHSGETVGFRNVIVRDLRRALTVVVLTNRNEPEPYGLALRIAEEAGEP